MTPAGVEKWAPVELGPIRASPTVGPGSADSSTVYAATAAGVGSKMYALRLSDGGDAGVCASSTGAPFLAGLALVQTISDNGPLESAVGISGANRLYTLRPKAQTPTDSACIEAFVTVQQTQMETIAGDASGLFIGAADNTTRSFVFDETSRNWVKNPGWPSGTALVGEGELGPIAISGTDLFATVRPDGLCRIGKSTGAVSRLGPDGGIKTDPSGPVVSVAQVFFSDTDLTSPRVWALDSVSFSGSGTAIGGPSRSVPVLGAGGILYLATNGGALEARSGGVSAWSTPLSENISASMTLDCSREAGVAIKNSAGVLYLGSTAGSLFSLVVDSPGLDADRAVAQVPARRPEHRESHDTNPVVPLNGRSRRLS